MPLNKTLYPLLSIDSILGRQEIARTWLKIVDLDVKHQRKTNKHDFAEVYSEEMPGQKKM